MNCYLHINDEAKHQCVDCRQNLCMICAGASQQLLGVVACKECILAGQANNVAVAKAGLRDGTKKLIAAGIWAVGALVSLITMTGGPLFALSTVAYLPSAYAATRSRYSADQRDAMRAQAAALASIKTIGASFEAGRLDAKAGGGLFSGLLRAVLMGWVMLPLEAITALRSKDALLEKLANATFVLRQVHDWQ